MGETVKVRMDDGRVVEMTRQKLARMITLRIGEQIVREAGILPTDSTAMRELKCACWSAVQQSRPQPRLD
jgi:hypothetical protein